MSYKNENLKGKNGLELTKEEKLQLIEHHLRDSIITNFEEIFISEKELAFAVDGYLKDKKSNYTFKKEIIYFDKICDDFENFDFILSSFVCGRKITQYMHRNKLSFSLF